MHHQPVKILTTMGGSSTGTTAAIAAAAFLGGCSVTAAVMLSMQRKKNGGTARTGRSNKSEQYYSHNKITTKSSLQQQQQRQLPAEIREEQLSRHTLFFGESGMTKLKQARVCVVGVGGVGSHTAHMLARAGIGYLRLIDFDQVTVSSLNRHAVATLDDVGQSKVECLARYLRRICPDERFLKVDTIAEMYTASTGDRLLKLPGNHDGSNSQWDMVIDCIDDVPTKAALLRYCFCHNIRVVSCMGAGGKADPSRLHISDMRSAAKDPLASKIRQTLKQTMKDSSRGESDRTYLDDMDQLTILFSSEMTVAKLAEFTPEQEEQGVHQFGAVDGMRIRLVPVLGTMPAIMGQALAAICVTTLAGKRLQPVTAERVGRNTRNKIYQKYVQREQNLFRNVRKQVQEAGERASTQETTSVNGNGELITIQPPPGSMDSATTIWIGQVQIDQADDMEYLLEIWRNRCAITAARLGVVLHLVRWDRSRPSTCDNVVLISANILNEFEADPGAFKASMDPPVKRQIEERLLSCRIDR